MATTDLTVQPTLLALAGDPDSSRAVYSIIALLVATGVALIFVAVWLYRSTRPDPELLAPLEAMGERKWRRADPVWQRRRLDALRPEGAAPLEPVDAPPELDVAFGAGPIRDGFEDLEGDDGAVDGSDDGDDLSPDPTATPTPVETERPAFEELPDHELDPDVLAAAEAQLAAELGDPRAEPAGAEQVSGESPERLGGDAFDGVDDAPTGEVPEIDGEVITDQDQVDVESAGNEQAAAAD